MAQICINEKVLSNIRNDNIAAVLNNLIDAELSKDIENIDSAFVDECVDALLAYEKENNNLAVLVPVISSEKFLKKLAANKHTSFKNLNVFAKTAIIAAIVAGSTFTANAMIYSATGVNVIETIAQRIEDRIDGNTADDLDESIVYQDNQRVTDADSETVTDTNETAVSEKNNTSQITDKTISSDNHLEKTAGNNNAKATVIKAKEPVTSAKPTIKQETKDGKVLTSVSADIADFKTNYIYGEKFSYDGLKLYCNYDDGSSEALKLSDCHYTKINITDETANYVLTIIYNSCKLEIGITVRPDEETRGSDICSNSDFNYLLTDKGAYITAYKGSAAELVMNYVDGNKVIAVGAGIFENNSVKAVRADYVNKLFENAFKNCTSLTKCIMPQLKYIGNSAFDGCESLTEIVYSDNPDYLGASAFRNTAFKTAAIPANITQIPDRLFENCSELERVDLKGRVTVIGKNAFADCTSLKQVNGCADITEVMAYAFYNDEKVTFDTFPQNIKTAGDCAFYLCTDLNIGALPQSITSLGKSSFTYCAGLKELTIPKGITVIPYEAFRGCGAKTVVIPEGVEVIESYGLRAVKATELVLPNSLKSIGYEGIYSPTLRKIYFGRNIESIADSAVYPSRSVMLYVYKDSAAMCYAADKSIKYEIIG